MNNFTIFVDEHDHLPCKIDFDGEITRPDELDANGRESQKGLLILALHTAMQLLTGAKSFNSLINTPGEYGSLISALFTPLSRANLSPSHWLVEVFNDQPRSRYLSAQTKAGRKVVTFTDTVSVRIVWHYSEKPCDLEHLRYFVNHWILDGFSPLEIFPRIEILSSMGYIEITKTTTSGYVTSPSQIRLTLDSNCPTHFCIFWIDSEGNLFCLYPEPDPILEIAPSKLKNTSKGRRVEIPEIEHLTIQTHPGTETCVILTNPTPFDDKLTVQIRNHLLSSEFNQRPFYNATTFRSMRLNTKAMEPSPLSKSRLGKPLSMDSWEQKVTSLLGSSAERIHFFHIPNKPHKST